MSILRGRRRAALILALVAAGATMLASPLVSSYAASPGMGVVSDSNRVASWTGAVTGSHGAGCKGAADPTCDNYKLTIQSPAYGFSVKIVLVPAGDWDLVGLRPRRRPGRELRQRPGPAGDRHAHESGGRTYTVARRRSRPRSGPTRQLYGERDATRWTPRHAGRPAPRGSPTRNYHAPNGIGGDAGEPSIGADLKTGKVMFQAGLQTLRASLRRLRLARDREAGGRQLPDARRSRRSTRSGSWTSGRTAGSARSSPARRASPSFTDDDGATWLPSEGGPRNGGVDHQTIGGGPFARRCARPGRARLPARDLLLLAGHRRRAVRAQRRRRPDLRPRRADLHRPSAAASTATSRSRPDGTVYVPNKNCGGEQGVVGLGGQRPDLDGADRSRQLERRLGSLGRHRQPTARSISATTTATATPKVAVSHDHGGTWTNVHGRRRAVRHPEHRLPGGGGRRRRPRRLRLPRHARRAPAARSARIRTVPASGTSTSPHLRRRQHLDDRRRDAERPGAARHDLRRRHHAAARHPQPARLHRRDRRQAGARARRLRRRLRRRAASPAAPNSVTALATIARQVNGARAVRQVRRRHGPPPRRT